MITEIAEPYQTINVKDYDELYIDGHKFPCRTKYTIHDKKLKDPKDLDGMIEQLSKTVSFTEQEKNEAMDILKRINYYKLSIFTKLLDDEKSFTRLLQLYNFDAFLKQGLSLLLKEIENLFKANLTYFMVNNYDTMSGRCEKGQEILINENEVLKIINNTEKHSSEFYLDYGVYETKNQKKIDIMLSQFAVSVKNKAKKELYIEHYIKNYGGHIPFWVLVETLTFGEIIYFYNYLASDIRKAWTNYFFKQEVVKNSEIEWLKTLQFLRNDCAHDNRLYGKTFNFTPLINLNDLELIYGKKYAEMSLKKKRSIPIEDHEKFDELKVVIEKTKKTLFSGLLVMRNFIQNSSQYTISKWNNFLNDLEEEIDLNNIPLMRIGFRHNWKNILTIA